MNREETLALFALGKDAWNAWANEMLAKKANLNSKERHKQSKFLTKKGSGKSKIRAWLAEAEADFSTDFAKHTFENPVDFSNFVFPGTVMFEGANFLSTARFECAKFFGTTWFTEARFSRKAWFDRATFSRRSWFEGATFSGPARFCGATFKVEARFGGATFSGSTRFSDAKFCGVARFRGAVFGASNDGREARTNTNFSNAQFLQSSHFRTAHFQGPVTFNDSRFGGEADFSSIQSDYGFTLSGADFSSPPNFMQAQLHREPRLDDARIGGFRRWLSWLPVPLPQLVGRHWKIAKTVRNKKEFERFRGIRIGHNRFRLPFTIDRDAPAKYRELRRYAKAGDDSARELDFHAKEIRTSRFVSDWPWHWRFWFGIFYGLMSNYGRSIAIPLLLWSALCVYSAGVYLAASPGMTIERQQHWALALVLAHVSKATPCVGHGAQAGDGVPPPHMLPAAVANDTGLLNEAFHLSLSNASVVGGLAGESNRRTYGCLYGVEGGTAGAPIVPHSVASWSIVQRVLSALLIFLFGLALRNMLKLR